MFYHETTETKIFLREFEGSMRSLIENDPEGWLEILSDEELAAEASADFIASVVDGYKSIPSGFLSTMADHFMSCVQKDRVTSHFDEIMDDLKDECPKKFTDKYTAQFLSDTKDYLLILIIENQDFVNAFMSSVCNQDIGELFVRHLQNPSSTLEDVIDEPIRAEERCVDQINLEDVGRMVLRTIEKVEQSRNKFSK